MDDKKNWRLYNSIKNFKTWIILDDMIAVMLSNKKLNPIGYELFVRGRKLNIFLYLSHNLALVYQKILDLIVHTILSWKFKTRASTNLI